MANPKYLCVAHMPFLLDRITVQEQFLKWNLFLSDHENMFSAKIRGNIEMREEENEITI